MDNNVALFFKDIVKNNSINFRGAAIGDTLDIVENAEGVDFKDTKGSLPNYKYFLEIGEMEELSIVYSYKEESKVVWNMQVRFSFYPKYYWEQAGGTNEMEFYELLKNRQLSTCIPDYTGLKEKLSNHFNTVLGKSERDNKDFVFKKPQHCFEREVWTKDEMILTMKSYIDDTKDPRGAITAEIVFILNAI